MFMLRNQGFDKFDQQERALDMFRQFATSKNVHITLVVHPRCVLVLIFRLVWAHLVVWL